jgi:hypothetical protein
MIRASHKKGREIDVTDSIVPADREQLFAKLADPAITGKFFERVSDSVSWTWTHPLAGTYTSKQAFSIPPSQSRLGSQTSSDAAGTINRMVIAAST